MWDFGSTKTVLLTVMSLPHSFSTYLEDILTSGHLDQDLNPHDSGLDVVSPQPVYRKSDGMFDAGKSSMKMKRQNDSTRIKCNLMNSDENLDEQNDEEIIAYDETKNIDFASKCGILTI